MQGVFDFSELKNALLSNNSFDSMNLDENDNTYLHHVVQHYNEDTEFIIRKLVNKHIILDHQNIYGQTIYHLAARYAPPHILKLLIELIGDFYSHDREMEIDDVYGNSVAHYACPENIHVLVEHEFKLNRYNFDGMTPLLDAVHKNHIQRACSLLENGVNPNCLDRNGNSVLHYCISHHIIRGPIMDSFISTPKAKCNIKNKDGFSPFDLAIIRKSPDLVKKLWYTWEFKDADFDPWLSPGQELSNTFRNYLQTLKECRRSTIGIT